MVLDVPTTLREFAATTSLHGVPRIINARSLLYRAFWSLTCLAGLLAFAWSARNLLAQYYSYPKKVRSLQFIPSHWCSVPNVSFVAQVRTEDYDRHMTI